MDKKPLLLCGFAALIAAGGVIAGIALHPPGSSASAPTAVPTDSCPASPSAARSSLDLTGYGAPDGIAVVAANTANSPRPTLSATAADLLKNLMLVEQARPTLWSATRHPRQLPVSLQKIAGTQTEKLNAAHARNNLKRMNAAIATPPAEAGLSLFEGVGVALDALTSQGARRPWIILIGSGLDDSGPLDTTAGLLAGDPRQTAERVAAANPGLNLKGVTILATSLGYAAPPQAIASAAQRQLVSDLWATTLTRLGATVIVDPLPAPACSVTTDQPVVPTEWPDVTVTCDAQVLTYELPSALLFDGDSAALRQGAADLLAEPVQILLDHPDTTVELVGHTASTATVTQDESTRLSTARAEAVAALLRQSGVAGSRVTARGVGDTEPKAEDLDPDGAQNEHAAGERRVDLFISGGAACPNG
ncbi:MAG: OmpA family protein [Propionibacteriaceae bacterium]|jgi:outer membrane protein OmpA-like peptidoglycan-associated protein|nr:OmpA family protein [Propionibacteriaceae bacterium]